MSSRCGYAQHLFSTGNSQQRDRQKIGTTTFDVRCGDLYQIRPTAHLAIERLAD